MELFVLLLAYVIVRGVEDITASIRGHKPPRHEYRMAKLHARQAGGGQVPQSSFGRYLTGLFDDAWDSAHHRRQLMADHRKEKRARRIATKKARQRRRWERKDAKHTGGSGMDATDNTGQLGPQQPAQPAPAGFAAQVPDPAARPVGPAQPHGPTPVGGDVDARDAQRPSDAAELDQFATDNPEIDNYASEIASVNGGWDSAGFYDAVREAKNARAAQHAREVAEGQRMAAESGESESPETASRIPAETDPVPDSKEVTDSALPSNVIPFHRSNVTPKRMELPVTNTEITGLDSAIAYAQGMASQCTHAYDQISAILPTGDETAASCEQARADLEAGGVTGRPLTDVSSVQEQMTGAITELQAALAQLEAAAAAANSLATELESHRGVQEAYTATPDAGSKEFVTAE